MFGGKDNEFQGQRHTSQAALWAPCSHQEDLSGAMNTSLGCAR